MLSRNQIRQAALQYLYAASQTPETEREGIWDILMEPFRGDYCKLKAKAVSGHLTRDYPDKLRLFITRARETADKLQQDPLTLPVRDQLQDLLAKEGEFNASLLRLKKALHEDPSNDKGVSFRRLRRRSGTQYRTDADAPPPAGHAQGLPRL